MPKYKVTDYFNNLIFETNKIIYAEYLVKSLNVRCKLFKDDKFLQDYWNGNEIDNEKFRKKFILIFEKK